MKLLRRMKREIEFVSLFRDKHSLDLYQAATGRTPEVAVLQDTGLLLYNRKGSLVEANQKVPADRLAADLVLEDGVSYEIRLPLKLEAYITIEKGDDNG